MARKILGFWIIDVVAVFPVFWVIFVCLQITPGFRAASEPDSSRAKWYVPYEFAPRFWKVRNCASLHSAANTNNIHMFKRKP